MPSPNDNSRIASDADATRLLREAAKAPTLAEQQRLIGESERVRTARLAQAERDRGLDLANAVVADTLTPVRVHEMHTAATDWIGELSTTASATEVESEMVAQASLWYSKTAAIRPFLSEWEEQAKGMARRLAGAFGEKASHAENAFLTHAATVYNRELKAGLFALAADGDGDADDTGAGMGSDTGAGQNDNDSDDNVGHTAASGLPQVGDPGAPVVGGTVGPPAVTGLDGELTSSERAPQLQLLEQNSGGGGGGDWPSPIVAPQHDVDAVNGDSGTESDHAQNNTTFANRRGPRKEQNMQTAACPSCRGRGRVAVRRQAASGLPQIEETVDANNQVHPENPTLTSGSPLELVAFPWEMNDTAKADSIAQAEQQIAERQKMVGSRRARAEMVARQAYRRVMAGQDDTGWIGDMGAAGNTPGEQDGGNPPPYDNLGMPDPVYGEGGDNGNQPLKPYGADEANDITNNPGTWQLGQPTQMDQGGRGMSTMSRKEDPEIAKALAFVRQRRAYLAGS